MGTWVVRIVAVGLLTLALPRGIVRVARTGWLRSVLSLGVHQLLIPVAWDA